MSRIQRSKSEFRGKEKEEREKLVKFVGVAQPEEIQEINSLLRRVVCHCLLKAQSKEDRILGLIARSSARLLVRLLARLSAR